MTPPFSRLFFALWPDEAVRHELHRCAEAFARDCHGRMTPFGNLHLTLVFLGNVAADRIGQLTGLAAMSANSAFDLEFGVTGYWRHNRIVWAAPRATPGALHALVAALEHGLGQAGFSFDRQSRGQEYTPHVTLLRNARVPPALPTLAFTWRVRDFGLIESVRGGRGPVYRVLARWPLAHPRTTAVSDCS